MERKNLQTYNMIYSYLMECTKTGVCKIGKSNNPLKRLETIKTGNPFVTLVGVSEIKEQELHKMYDEFRFSGEWFDFPENIKKEVYLLFNPFTDSIKNKNNIISEELLKKIKTLDENFDIVKVNEFTDIIFNKLGADGYRNLLQNCEEFNLLVSKSIYLSI